MPDDDLKQTIIDAAKSPEQVSVDGQSVKARSLSDVIAADKHLATKSGSKSKTRGIHYAKFTQPGTYD